MSVNQQFTQPPVTTLGASVRLDAQMQQRVIARALELQNRHQNTLSAEQLETIAAEAGIDPVFVRQAVVEVTVAGPVARRRERLRPFGPSGLWEHRRALAMAIGLSTFLGGGRIGDMLDLRMLPLLIAAWFGGELENKRSATVAGMVIAIGNFIGWQGWEYFHYGLLPVAFSHFSAVPSWIFAGGCGGAGLLGASLRQWADKHRMSAAREDAGATGPVNAL